MSYKTLFLMCCFLSKLFCHNITAQPLALPMTEWRFKTGDDLMWATPQYNDADWQNISVGTPWETVIGDYDSIAWYRKTLVIDRKTYRCAVKCGGGMVLHIGKIDDADETYFNGIKIGAMGEFPPAKITAWDVERAYIVPRNIINWHHPNVIAVRVADWGGGGGMYGGDYKLEPLTWKQKVKIDVETHDKTHTYALNQPIDLNITLSNNSRDNISGNLVIDIQTYSDKTVATQSHKIQVLKGQKMSFPPFQFDSLPTGFYHALVTFQDLQGISLKEKYGFAVAPTAFVRPPTLPADFDAFWKAARTELDSVPPQFTLTPTPQYSTEKTDVFEVEMHSLGDVRVRGFYAKPKKKGVLPAILHLQGYSSYMLPYDVDAPYIQFFMNIRGHGNSRDDVNPGFPGYLFKGIDSPQTYIYRGAYMDCIRAVDFLCSRAEVDTSRIGVEGASQGGALSFVTAALDKRIKLCATDVPFLSDFRNYFQIADWPANEFKMYSLTHFKKMDTFFNVLDYFDIRNHTPSVTCPVLMGVGLFDPTCPPAINFAAYNNVSSLEKNYRLYPISGHGLPSEHYDIKKQWIIKSFF